MDHTELKTVLNQMVFVIDVSIEADNSWAVVSKRAIIDTTIIGIDGLVNHEIKEKDFSPDFIFELVKGRTFFMSNTVPST
jgi:hypothetical protein